ncbi:NAD(P)H-dependent oxidoreductase [Anoxynatronum sibiricum]|uniref:NAD(P)H-dependent oxidoreductase n=1 Tax=Anoxynatronum sibiricum TaxID=210623 RepID=A0ABU9VV19_9CLOT
MLVLIRPKATQNFIQLINQLIPYSPNLIIDEATQVVPLPTSIKENSPALFIILAVELDDIGSNGDLLPVLYAMKRHWSAILKHSVAMLMVKSPNEWHTKTFSSWLIFNLNQWGCRFIGHPLVEMIPNLENLGRWEKTTNIAKIQLLHDFSQKAVERLMSFDHCLSPKPKLAVLHASSRKTSNTFMLWHLVKEHLKQIDIEEFHVANGTIIDCIGCPYQTCVYYGRQKSCFYGGDMIRELIPAIEQADALLWLCPNYNDAVSANLMAVINRLTAYYRTHSFNGKQLFSIVVSGNSGGDAVARQLIDALCINKGFQLPPKFCLSAIAYDPGSILEADDIKKRAASYAAQITDSLFISQSIEPSCRKGEPHL